MMWQQKSYQQNSEKGSLYLVPTPIGNLEDMTFRAIRSLKEADYIAAEDTRQTRKLCNHFEIEKSIISYHEHNKQQKGKEIIHDLLQGKTIALVSDAGMPCISDPGVDLVELALQEEIAVIPLPGANAALTSLIASGLNTEHFMFYGFLPRQKKHRKEIIEELNKERRTLIFYEAPHRLKEMLLAIHDGMGNRKAVISRELTKKFEEFIRGSLDELIDWCNDGEVRGEFCIIVEGNQGDIKDDKEVWWVSLSIIEHVDHYIHKGQSNKEALKSVAKDRGISKREVYQDYHIK